MQNHTKLFGIRPACEPSTHKGLCLERPTKPRRSNSREM